MIDIETYQAVDNYFQQHEKGTIQQIADFTGLPESRIRAQIAGLVAVEKNHTLRKNLQNGVVTRTKHFKTDNMPILKKTIIPNECVDVTTLRALLFKHSILSYKEMANHIGCELNDVIQTVAFIKNGGAKYKTNTGAVKKFSGRDISKDYGHVWLQEAVEQMLIFKWKEKHLAQFPQLEMLFATANGGERPAQYTNGGGRFSMSGQELKMTGVEAGIPDIFLDVPMHGYGGLRIELKPGIPTRKRGKYSSKDKPEQHEWINKSNKRGYCASFRWGHQDAINEICRYLGVKVLNI